MRTTQHFMTRKPITVHDTDSVGEAQKKMKALEVRHLPVINAKGDVVGLLSDRDVQRAGVNHSQPVKDYMSAPIQTVGAGTPLRKVALMMLENKISSYLVEGPDGEMIGIITTDDILKAFLKTESKIWEAEV